MNLLNVNLLKKIIKIFTLTSLVILLAAVNTLAYDLVVYQAEPEGVAAAVAAARSGLNTALVMEQAEPGGLFTYGALNFLDLNYDRNGNNINQGIFKEWHNLVGGGVSFKIKEATQAFNSLLAAEENLTLYRNHSLKEINKNGRLVQRIKVEDPSGKTINLTGEYFIDASQNGELAYKAGNPYFFGGGDINQPDRFMPVTPIIKIKNIDKNRLQREARSGRHGQTVVKKGYAYGFSALGARYQPRHPEAGLRGLNLVLEDRNLNGETVTFGYINALHFYGVDGSDKELLADLHEAAKAEAELVVDFLSKELEAMRNVEFIGIAEEFYVRETRHFVTEKQLDVKAQLTARIPEDTVALASYPLDYQSHAPGAGGFVYFNPGIYGKPLRSLISVDFDNLLIAGRASGQSSIAHSSGRIVPNGMVAAEGAGLAIAKAVANNLRPKEVADNPALMAEIQSETGLASQLGSGNIRNLQRELVPGDYVEPVAELLSWGLIVGGYENNFRLDETLTERTFVYLLLNGLKNRDASVDYPGLSNHLAAISSTDQPVRYNKVQEITEIIGDYAPGIESQEFIEILKNWQAEREIESGANLTRGQIYHLAVAILNQFELSEKLKLYRNK